MILQKIKKSIEKIGIPCFLDYNDATSYCAVLIPETNGKESIKVDIQFIWEDGNPILLADKWIKSLRMNKELKVIVLGSENNYAGFVLRVKVIDVSICSYIPTGNRYTITIVNDPAKGTATGGGVYRSGETCTLTAYPNEQYYFVGWLTPDDDVVHDNPYSFTVDGDATYETYYLSKYHVVVQSSGNGTATGTGYYLPTDTCTITATPNAHYHFVNWTVNGLELTTNNPYSFIPTGDITITANFAIDTYTVSVSTTQCSISGEGTYDYGDTCTLEAYPDTGYYFVGWYENDEELSTDNPYSFTVNSNRNITALVEREWYYISASSSGNGSVSGEGSYQYGTTCTLEATPDAGYEFDYWDEAGQWCGEDNPWSFTVDRDMTLTGNFVQAVPLTPLTITTTGTSSVILTNSNNETYELQLVNGENVYNGEEPGFGLGDITSVSKEDNPTNIISIDASGLSSWTVMKQSAFYGCNNLVDIILPDTMTTISAQAFENCQSLASITLPESITTISGYAFNYCSVLDKITLLSSTPPTVDSSSSFSGIYDEFLIYVPKYTLSAYQNTSWNNIQYGILVENELEPVNDYLFAESLADNCYISIINSNSETYSWELSKGKNYYIGDEPGFALNEITEIKRTNSNYNKILSVDASKLTSWTTVGYDEFGGCNRLSSFILPSTITNIGTQPFQNCSRLYSINLPEGLTIINTLAFANCSKLKSVVLPNSLTSIGSSAFQGCSKIVSVNIPANVSSIYGNPFSICYALDSITVDSNNQYYDDGNGSNCIIETATNTLVSGCANTTIPNTIVSIGNTAFYRCDRLASITLPDSLTTIGSSAFNYCYELTSLHIPANVSSIADQAFSYCYGLTSIIVDSNNITYNDGNGSNCIIETATNKLILGCKNTIIPNTVVSIGNYAFEGCSGLTSITIPNTITSIGIYAFQNARLETITIPSSVSSIGLMAFWNNTKMIYMEFEGTTPATIGSNVFSSGFPLYVPSSAVSDYQTAWSSYSSRIMAKPQPTGSDYLMVMHGYDMQAKIRFTNANNDTYDWTVNQGINYYNGEEPGFAINEITGIKARGISGFSSYIKSIDASKLTSITSIEYEAFSGCSGLTSFIFPSSLTTIGQSAFSNCRSLTSITIPNSVSVISQDAFNGCDNLTSVALSNSLTTLGRASFMGCLSLASITLPNTLTLLGTQTFANCKLTSLTIPASILTIGSSVVANCPLQSLTVLATTPPTTDYAFDGSYPIYVPAASLSDYEVAPVWSYYYGLGRIQAIPTP